MPLLSILAGASLGVRVALGPSADHESDRERLRDGQASTEDDPWQRQSRRLPRDGLQVDRVRQRKMANTQRFVPFA